MKKQLRKIQNKRMLMAVVIIAIVVAVLIVIIIVASATGKYHQGGRLSVINVKAETTQQKTIPIIFNSIGSLYPSKSVQISAQVAGTVQSVLFKYGANVTKGEPLYCLDKDLYQAQYQAAESDLHLSQLDYQRAKQLLSQQAIARQALDKAQSNYQDKLSALKAQYVRLNKMTIRAPFSGVIGASKVDVGQFVASGKPLTKLVDKARLTVRFSVPEQYLSQLLVGQHVVISSSAFPGSQFSGKVSFVSPTVNPTSRTVMVWAIILNPNLQLAPGLFVHVALTVGEKQHALFIPQQALIPTISGDDVFTIKGNKAYQHAVITGQLIGSRVIIKKGLSSGEMVVTLGQEKLSNGRLVKVLSK